MASRNLITDVAGIRVGNADDPRLASGVTAAVFDKAMIASAAILGGAPGTRDTEPLAPENLVSGIDAIVLSGGSAFGLDAGSGVQAWLREQGRGFGVGDVRVPLVSQAISFDLLNGGDKAWGRFPPYRELGYAAAASAAETFALGTAGGGHGATTVNLKGGLGSASAVSPSGFVVGALVVVNAIASAVIGEGPHFWAGGYEIGNEFGGLGWPARVTPPMQRLAWKGGLQTGTTIALVATDARLDKAMCKRLAIAATGGLHKGLRFAHGLTDGDAVFAVSTRRSDAPVQVQTITELGAVAGDVLARAIARGIYEASALPFAAARPAWRDRFGQLTP